MLSLWLITLHMLGDYITQNDWMAKEKFDDWRVRTLHVAIYTIPFGVLASVYEAQKWTTPRSAGLFIGLVFVTHWLTDCRRWVPANHPWPLKGLFVDQTLHMLQLAIFGSIFLH